MRPDTSRVSATANAAAPIVAPGADDLIKECDRKIARYRAALDAGADPALVAGWIAETQAERSNALALSKAVSPREPLQAQLNTEEITELLNRLGNMITVLEQAQPEHKMEVYRALGLKLTYRPETQTVHAEIDLGMHRWDMVRVEGGT
ncbi:hypothetical protein GCM10009682_25170 [Luedemannella flava]|uniref:Uncharacterized protein n=1 Tax=Luedemannella flava TaxID=349316 RepID=A0ABP4Y9T2_9ACTN